MAVKSLFLLGVVLAFVLLTSLDMAYANEVTEASDSKGNNLEPAVEEGLNNKQVFVGIITGGPGQPGYGAGYGRGYGGRRYGGFGFGYGRRGYVGGRGYRGFRYGRPGYVGGGLNGVVGGPGY